MIKRNTLPCPCAAKESGKEPTSNNVYDEYQNNEYDVYQTNEYDVYGGAVIATDEKIQTALA